MEIVPAYAPPILAIASAAGTFALSGWIGRGFVRRLPGVTSTEAMAASMLIGCASLMLVAMALGLCQMLRPTPFLGVAVTFGALSTYSSRSAAGRMPPPPHERDPTVARFLRISAIAFLPLFFSAFEPPQFVDACNYHLPLIDHYARQAGLSLAIDQQLPTFGIAFHVLATVPYQLGGETAVQLLHLGFFALGGLVLVGVGERIGRPRIGILAAALWWGQPAFASNATQALVDCAWPAFAAMAIALAMPTESRSKNLRFALVGLLAGTASATKYTGAIACLAAVVLTLRACRQHRSWRLALSCCAGLILGLGPVFAWNAWTTGDPLFPYLLQWLPNPFWDAADLALQRTTWYAHGAGHGISDVLLLPWRLVAEPTRFLTAAPLSPLLCWFLFPLSLPFVLRQPSGRFLLAMIALATTIWFSQSQQTRFLSGVVLAMAWLAAVGTHASLRHPRLLATLTYASLAALPMLGCVRLWRHGVPPVSLAERDSKVLARDPELGTLWALAKAKPGARVFALFGQHLRHLACAGRPLALIGDWFGPGRFRDVWDHEQRRLRNPLDALDAKGIDHLYVRATPDHAFDLRSELATDQPSVASRLRCVQVDGYGALFSVQPVAATPRAEIREITIDRATPTTPSTTWCIHYEATTALASPPALEFLDEHETVVHRVLGGLAVGDRNVLAGTTPARASAVRIRRAPPRALLTVFPAIE